MINDPTNSDWLGIAEMEEFFAEQDARSYSVRNDASVLKEAFSYSNVQKLIAEEFRMKGIYVTHIVPPAKGWPIAMYCPICKETTFLLSPWAMKPERGDYWRMSDICVHEIAATAHNVEMMRDRMLADMLKMTMSPKHI